MSTKLEAELRAAFESATESLAPRPGLADRVRQSVRRRTRRVAAVTATMVGVVALIAAGLVAAGRHGHHAQPQSARFRVEASAVDALAVGRRYLYVATDANTAAGPALSAYDRITGRLVARILVPASISDVVVGPDGLVWLVLNSGRNDLWLLSPNLRLRSAPPVRDRFGGQSAISDVLPVGATTALLAGDGAASIDMPWPGRAGTAAIRWLTPAVHTWWHVPHVPEQVAELNGRLVVLWGSDVGRSVITFRQPARPVFTEGGHIGLFMAAQGGGLWVFSGWGENSHGSLIRLNDRLQVVTPQAIAANPLLRSVQEIWVSGHTVWVQIPRADTPLACFSYRNGQVGRVATLRDPGAYSPSGGFLAATGDTVYVADTSYVNNGMGPQATGTGVVARQVPGPCR
jgi:hypothetical protein